MKGIPFDLAFSLDDDTAKAFQIIMTQILIDENGSKGYFDWYKQRFIIQNE